MGFRNKEEFLDSLFDHIFPSDDGEPSDEDKEWFENISKFFDQFDADDTGGTDTTSTNPPRRRRTTTTQPPRRRPRTNTASRSDDSSYGNKTFFGGK